MKKQIKSLSLHITIVAAITSLLPANVQSQSLPAESLLEHVRILSSDEWQGRESGEPGADSAAAYIEQQFRLYGLEPLFEESFRQAFTISTSVSVSPESRLVISSATGSIELSLGEDWFPYSFSSGGMFEASGTNGGYGLSSGDFDGLESGTAVVLDGGVPDDMPPHGIDPSPRRRATLARDAGASVVMVLVPDLTMPQVGLPPNPVGIPALQLKSSDKVKAVLADADLRVELDLGIEPVTSTAYNIGGRLRGTSDDGQLIVVGAHYDHLGLGGPGSLAPESSDIHNGADDNASGTAVLLGLAKAYSERGVASHKDLIFVAFAAEEMGLLGSDHFAENPPTSLENVRAMINFDMVGRLRDGKLQIFGTETAEELPGVIDEVAALHALNVSSVGDGYGPSDQTSFYSRGVPVLHFFSGTHSEYHRPEDDWDLINATGMSQIGAFAMDIIDRLGETDQKLTYVRQQRPERGGRGGYGPYLGTIPDFGEVEGGGLRLSGVRSGSPAEEAGLQGGDVVIRFGEKEVMNIYDYTYALRDHAPGDTVLVRVRRDSVDVDVTVVLGERK